MSLTGSAGNKCAVNKVLRGSAAGPPGHSILERWLQALIPIRNKAFQSSTGAGKFRPETWCVVRKIDDEQWQWHFTGSR
jgi:hypothetical protein